MRSININLPAFSSAHLRFFHLTLVLLLVFSLTSLRAIAEEKDPLSIEPRVSFSPSRLDFGDCTVGEKSNAKSLALTNEGAKTITIDKFVPKGDFLLVDHHCTTPLNPGSSCRLTLKFSPKETDKRDGTLEVNYKVTGSENMLNDVLELQGRGSASWREALLPALAIVLIYFAGIVVFRWNMIALPTRGHLRAHIEAARHYTDALYPTSAQEPPGLCQVKKLLDRGIEIIGAQKRLKFLDWFFWTRGQELSGWNYLHQAEEQLVFYLPDESVRALLESTQTKLRQLATPSALDLAQRIQNALAAAPTLPRDRCEPVLKAALKFIAPETATLASEVKHAAHTPVDLTPDQYRQLAEKVVAVLSPQGPALAEQIKKLTGDADSKIEQLRPLLDQAVEVLRSQEQALIEELKKAIDIQPPPDIVQWKLLLGKVDDFLTPEAAVLAENINQALRADPILPLNRWKALLAEARNFLFDTSDVSFSSMISWHNKTMWLIVCGLLLIVCLTAILHNGVLFIAGATGGLLSRLQRSLYRQDVPTDYGASWTTLFLSPVVGALAGWSGVLLLTVLSDLNVLGAAVKVDWYAPYVPVTLGFALLLGISERLLNGFVASLENKLTSKPGVEKSTETAGLKIETTQLPDGKIGQTYPVTNLAASGGVPPYTWELADGTTLPSGLALDSSGKIAGTPSTEGAVSLKVKATDAERKSAVKAYMIQIGK